MTRILNSLVIILIMVNLGFARDVSIVAIDRYNTGDGPFALDFADFNEDGYKDLVVANNYSSDISIMLSNGDATFDIDSNYTTGINPVAVYAAFLDNDSHYDIVTANTADSNISIFFGNGDGTFQNRIDINITEAANIDDVTGGDLNGDGYIDLVVTNFHNPLGMFLLINNGDGTFADPTFLPAAYTVNEVVLAEFDYQNGVDVAVSLDANSAAGIYFNNGDGTFSEPQYHSNSGDGEIICIGHLNDDGYNDIFIAGREWFVTKLNNGAGQFSASAGSFIFQLLSSSFATDLNGDNIDGVLTTCTLFDLLFILPHDVDGSLKGYYAIRVDESPESVVSFDFDGDGDNDIAVASSVTDSVTIFLNYLCGDAENNGAVNILDITYLISYLYKGGPEPILNEGVDADFSGAVNILDITYLIAYLYQGGSQPQCADWYID